MDTETFSHEERVPELGWVEGTLLSTSDSLDTLLFYTIRNHYLDRASWDERIDTYKPLYHDPVVKIGNIVFSEIGRQVGNIVQAFIVVKGETDFEFYKANYCREGGTPETGYKHIKGPWDKPFEDAITLLRSQVRLSLLNKNILSAVEHKQRVDAFNKKREHAEKVFLSISEE